MRTAAILLILVCVATPVVRAQDLDQRDVKSKLIALERLSKMQATRNKDLKTLSSVFDDRFLTIDPQGKLQNKSDVLAFVQEADFVQYLTESEIVKLHGDTAIVTGLFQMKFVIHGKQLVFRGRFVDTWMLRDGQWTAIASLAVPEN